MECDNDAEFQMWERLGEIDKTTMRLRIGRIIKSETQNEQIKLLQNARKNVNLESIIRPSSDYFICLGASQMTNIGYDFDGDYTIITKQNKRIGNFSVINSFGSVLNGLANNDIVISCNLAETHDLKIGDEIILERVINDIGKLKKISKKIKREEMSKIVKDAIPCGMDWNIMAYNDKLCGMVQYIEECDQCFIGASAMFINNIFGNNDHGPVKLSFNGKTCICKVKNMTKGSGCGFHISRKALEELNVGVGNFVCIERQ